jgi:hypothetical protein
MAPQGAEQKDGRDQSTPFGLRKWWVRKSEHTWVRFRERRGRPAGTTLSGAVRILIVAVGLDHRQNQTFPDRGRGFGCRLEQMAPPGEIL